MMTGNASPFLKLFNLKETSLDFFCGYGPQTRWRRVFGGLVISQALAAATRTVEDDRSVHSLHAYFILPGDTALPIDYHIERLRDGRSFSTRYCKAIQNGQTIFVLTASYHVHEEGLQHAEPMPSVAGPDGLMSFFELQQKYAPGQSRTIFEYFSEEPPLEFRPADPARYYPAAGHRDPLPRQDIWFKSTSSLPDDICLHQQVLAYASDMTLLDCAVASHNRSVTDGSLQPASLDHSIWFHRPFRADDWLLYTQQSPNANAGRGLAFGYIYTAVGDLVATIAQEGLIRIRRG